MADAPMLTVFCYDVVKDRTRRRLARLLEDAMVRVQDSVFEALMTADQSDALAERAAALLGEGDSLRVYAISASGRRRSRAYGGAPLMEDQGYYLL